MDAKTALEIAKEQISIKDAKHLLCFCENITQTTLIANPDITINEDRFFSLVKRRANSEPLEYITNIATFLDYNFFVTSSVLIPRFETEILVDIAIDLAKKHNFKTIADICTGSGIIATILSLKTEAKIYASDISKDALIVAKKNAQNLNADVEFKQGDLILPFVNEHIDLIVSNPPYIANSYELDSYVLNEPHLALFGGERGDELLVRLLDMFLSSSTKAIACEMGYDQKSYIQSHCDKIGLKPFFYKDLANFDRGFYIIK